MEDKKNIQIDAFLKKQLQEMPLESPSNDFTNNVMSVLEKETTNATQYAPLISKKVWTGIATLIIATVLLMFSIPIQNQGGSILDKIPVDFSLLENISLKGIFDGLTISSTTFYGMLLFSVMISIQIFYIKGYFSKRTSGL